MGKADRFTWVVYGGVASAIAFSMLSVVMLALAKLFIPHSVHMSWGEAPILLFLTLPCGFMVGGWVGYELAPKTRPERIAFLKDGLFLLVVMLIGRLIMSNLWKQPEAKDHFWASVAWEIIPLLLAVGLQKIFKRGKHKA